MEFSMVAWTQGVFKNLWVRYALIFLITAALTALVIYTTPLRYTPLIPPTIDDVEAGDVYAQMQQNPDSVLLLDVRSVQSFSDGHAVGAKSAPLHTLYFLKETLPRKGKTIALICSGGVASGVGFSYLEHYGFTNVIRVKGGIEAWRAAGLPVASGTDPYLE